MYQKYCWFHWKECRLFSFFLLHCILQQLTSNLNYAICINIYNIVPQKHWHLGIWQTYNSNPTWYIKNWKQMIWLTSIKLQTKSPMLLTQEFQIEKCNKHFVLIQAYDRIINISKKDNWLDTWQFQSTKKNWYCNIINQQYNYKQHKI
jgi:hypothetical protein